MEDTVSHYLFSILSALGILFPVTSGAEWLSMLLWCCRPTKIHDIAFP
ncbi:hypothetical protein [Vreelandella glaciei]